MANASSTATVAYPSASPAAPRRTFFQQVVHDTFTQRGARFASVWLITLVFLAIAAPYIASSHPILMKVGGVWSSPMWEHLTYVDLTLTALALVVVVLLCVRQVKFGMSLVILLGTVAVVGPLAYQFKDTPTNVNFQKYRDIQRSGQVEVMIKTVIPFSPTDRLRDLPQSRLSPPSWSVPLKDALHRIAPGTFDKPGDDVRTKLAALPAWSLLGTETDGADLASRMIHASRIALSIGLISTSIAITIGIIIGGLMGYYVGKVDLFGMRLIEVFEAIPTLLVLITVMTAYGRNIYYMMIVIGLLSWTGTARFIRAEFLKLRQQDFVQAAVAVGLSRSAVIYRHILPNGLTPVLVTATFGVAAAILTEAVLSFLGLGLIDEPSWGQMLNQARSGGQGFVWWMALFPGAAIFLTVYAYALVGDAMRDALDPKLRKRE